MTFACVAAPDAAHGARPAVAPLALCSPPRPRPPAPTARPAGAQPKMDMSRFVRWPRYIRLQRQRKILKTRLKVPPAINQFTNTLDKNQGASAACPGTQPALAGRVGA